MSRRKRRNKRRNNERSFGDFLLKTVLIICALALCLSYLSVFVDPSNCSIPLFFGLFYIPLAAINIFFMIIAIVRGKKYMLIPILALMPAICFAELYAKIGCEEKSHTSEPVKIVTYNVGRYSAGNSRESREAKVAHIRDFLQREDADVICLQEFSVADTTTISSILPKLPYRHFHLYRGNSYFGNITLSKYPIVKSGILSFPKSTNLCIWSDVKFGCRIVRIYNCHLESYAMSFTALIKKLSRKGHFSDEMVQVHGKMRGTNVRRSGQVSKLMENIAGSDSPVIICGDLNDTPMSYTYHRLSSGCKDSFLEGGSGFSSTYSTLWPLLRIDYILLPDQYSADNHRITRIGCSDHYPVSSYIYFE